jgi:hypothetical protein
MSRTQALSNYLKLLKIKQKNLHGSGNCGFLKLEIRVLIQTFYRILALLQMVEN